MYRACFCVCVCMCVYIYIYISHNCLLVLEPKADPRKLHTETYTTAQNLQDTKVERILLHLGRMSYKVPLKTMSLNPDVSEAQL